jgi:uncharacterized heparinase superfamily protein
VRLEQGEAVAFLDVAEVGPDYLPGHAHADSLSFELSLFGQRVVVNSGTSQYGLGAERCASAGRRRIARLKSMAPIPAKCGAASVWPGGRDRSGW